MRKLLTLAILLTVGLVGYGRAAEYDGPYGFTSTISTGVLVSSNVPIVLYRVEFSTGNDVDYAVILDSNTTGPEQTGNFQSVGVYTRSQWVTPAHVFASTAASSVGTGSDWNRYLEWPQGILIKNGLTLFQSATGNHVTFYWRKPRY